MPPTVRFDRRKLGVARPIVGRVQPGYMLLEPYMPGPKVRDRQHFGRVKTAYDEACLVPSMEPNRASGGRAKAPLHVY